MCLASGCIMIIDSSFHIILQFREAIRSEQKLLCFSFPSFPSLVVVTLPTSLYLRPKLLYYAHTNHKKWNFNSTFYG